MISKHHFTTEQKMFFKKGKEGGKEGGRKEERKGKQCYESKKKFFKFLKNNDLLGISND